MTKVAEQPKSMRMDDSLTHLVPKTATKAVSEECATLKQDFSPLFVCWGT